MRLSARFAHHLNQAELARRWRISPRTLERWRWLRQGPSYLKIGGRVAYRLSDVEAYEAAQRHANPTAEPSNAASGR
jgi:hypothetical protein